MARECYAYNSQRGCQRPNCPFPHIKKAEVMSRDPNYQPREDTKSYAFKTPSIYISRSY